jgi:hypothetical protein
MKIAAAWALCAIMSACSQPDRRQQARSDAAPIDASRIRIDEASQWRHRRVIDADLTADGRRERIVLAADVMLNDAGVPLWEDGHRWAVFVEEGERHTLVYGAFVPNGEAEAAVLAPDGIGSRRHLLVRERTPQQLRTIVIGYDGPDAVRTISAAHYQIEHWLPPLAVR